MVTSSRKKDTMELQGRWCRLWLQKVSFTLNVYLSVHPCHLGVFGPHRDPAPYLLFFIFLDWELRPDHTFFLPYFIVVLIY